MEIIKLFYDNFKDLESISIFQVDITTKKFSKVFNLIGFYYNVKNTLQNKLNKVPDRLGMIMKLKQDLNKGATFIANQSVLNKIIFTYISELHFLELVLATSKALQSNVSVFTALKNNNANSCTGVILSSSTINVIVRHCYPVDINDTWETSNSLGLIINLQVSSTDELKVN